MLPVRRDLTHYKDHGWYEILTKTGKIESFEREHYDMARSAFLKYRFVVHCIIGPADNVLN